MANPEQLPPDVMAAKFGVGRLARHLFVSVNTVRKQVVALRAKLGASSRAELVRRARELGLE